MTITAIREKLYDYIKEADDKKIEAIYSLFEDQMAPSVNWWEDEEVVAELDERVQSWKDGIDPAYTWDEVERSINDLKNKRNAKKRVTTGLYNLPKPEKRSLRPGNGTKTNKLV